MNFYRNFLEATAQAPSLRLWVGCVWLLFCFTVVNSSVWGIFAWANGWDMNFIADILQNEENYITYRGELLVLVALSQVVTWGLAGWGMMVFFQIQQSPMKGNKRILLFIGILMMFAAIPLVQAVALDAESFRLPAFLSSFDQWMRMREHQSFLMIKSFIDTKNFMSLCLNLVVLAFVPAVCEELFFRGFLQKTLGDIFSPFAAIFLTACIFSILHFQFYGIFSRLLLGGIIGYLYYLSGNITPGILAHFAYNSLMVVIGYIYRLSGLEIPDIEEKAWRQPLPWLIVSFIVLVVLIHLSYRMIHEERPPR